ncbi:MAG: lamin tail domain-containing protein, partial [Candidatus Saccharibacteria bacterium]
MFRLLKFCAWGAEGEVEGIGVVLERRQSSWMTVRVIPLIAVFTFLIQLFVGAGFGATAHAAQINDHVVINEIYLVSDPGTEWIELYNPTATPVVLTGWKLNDQTLDPGIIASKGFVGFNVTGLSGSGGTTTLYDATTTSIDSVAYGAVPDGDSYARIYDGNDQFEIRSDSGITHNLSNGTTPRVSNLDVENDVSGVVGSQLTVSANAIDNDAVDHVDFYVNDSPGSGDGNCSELGTRLATQAVTTADGDGKYRTTFNMPGGLNADYCVAAVAYDADSNASSVSYQKIHVDTVPP